MSQSMYHVDALKTVQKSMTHYAGRVSTVAKRCVKQFCSQYGDDLSFPQQIFINHTSFVTTTHASRVVIVGCD